MSVNQEVGNEKGAALRPAALGEGGPRGSRKGPAVQWHLDVGGEFGEGVGGRSR